MARIIGLPLAAGLLSALFFLSLAKGIALGFLLSYGAPLPVMMAGLALGQGAAGVAGFAGAAAVAMGGDLLAALPFLVAVVIPSLVVANRALLWRNPLGGGTDWYPPGAVLAWLAGAATLLILAGTIFVPAHQDGLEGWMAEAIGRTLELLASDVPAEQRRIAVAWWTPLFPAMVAGSWLVMSVVNAVAAQGILVRLKRNRRPSPAYRDLCLPHWLGLVLAGATGIALLAEGGPGYVAQNVAAVVVLPFVFLGLAAVHCWAAGKPHAGLILAAFYGVLFVAFAWAVVIVAGLGLLRYWKTNLRQPAKSGGAEEE